MMEFDRNKVGDIDIEMNKIKMNIFDNISIICLFKSSALTRQSV